MRTFNTLQAAKFIGLPVDILMRMRLDSTRRHDTRGPPYHHVMEDGKFRYRYKERELIEWMKLRNCRITANDAAFILGISRTQVMEFFGLQRRRVGSGDLVIHSSKNFFLFVSKKQKKLKQIKGRKK
jgi:hypothetical protein